MEIASAEPTEQEEGRGATGRGSAPCSKCCCSGKVVALTLAPVALGCLCFMLGVNLGPKIWAAEYSSTPTCKKTPLTASTVLPRGGVYESATGVGAHVLPEYYAHVKEKTIWLYWHNPDSCPNSKHCTLPPFIQLCVDSMRHNAGSFDVRIVHQDEVFKYVNPVELPWKFNSHSFRPAQRKDSLMNALLARYGGVAFDISNVLLRPMDDLWNEMVADGAGFRGYMYRLNGQSWGNTETMAVWFLMARREGLFRSVATSAVINMGDDTFPDHMTNPYFGLGDGTLAPIISMYDFNLPTCREDPQVRDKKACPEYNAPIWKDLGVMEPLTHTKLMLSDPREGPQFMFAWLDDMNWATWKITDDRCRDDWKWTGCCSPKQCWSKLMERYDSGALPFVKFFGSGGARVKSMSRKVIVEDVNSIAHQLFSLSGLNLTDSAATLIV